MKKAFLSNSILNRIESNRVNGMSSDHNYNICMQLENKMLHNKSLLLLLTSLAALHLEGKGLTNKTHKKGQGIICRLGLGVDLHF